LYHFWNVRLHSRIAYYVVIAESIINIFRFMWCAIDPIGSTGAFAIYGVQRFFLTNTVPWEISTSIAISFYWFDTVNRVKGWQKEANFMVRGKVKKFLPTLQWISVVACGSLILLDLLNTIVMSQFSDPMPLVISSFLLLGMIEISVACFFITAGVKIISVLHKFQQLKKNSKIPWYQYLNPNRPSRVQLMSLRIMISGLGLIITGVSSFLASSTVFDLPYGYVLIMFFMTFGMMVTSLTHVLAFVPKTGFKDNSEEKVSYKGSTGESVPPEGHVYTFRES